MKKDLGQYNWMTPPGRMFNPPADERTGSERRPTWWMRRELSLAHVPESLVVNIVCLGYYELYVNGQRVGAEPLAPSISRLDRRGFVIAHDITSRLRKGKNCLAIWCASGWYLPHQFSVHEDATPLLGSQFVTGERADTHDSGDADSGGEKNERPTSNAQHPTSNETPNALSPDPHLFDSMLDVGPRTLDVQTLSRDAVSLTCNGPWLCRASNRVVTGPWQWNQFGGEEVDARAYLPDWNRVGCDTSEWSSARKVSPPPIELSERMCPPNRIGEIYPAASARKLGDRHFEVDFGTCLSGWVDIRFADLAKGQKVILRFYDLPADNDRIKDHSYGQCSVYHARGEGEERFTNKFNYAGFRYMTIEGVDRSPTLKNMRAMLVECALERAGHFRCSNELYNRIHTMNLQTLRCLNLGAYSVDCPQRERNGYGADGQTALPAYLYLFDAAAFLRKWLVDWCDVYEPDTGRISLCAPTRHARHAPAWGGIVAPLAWSLYLYYGDREALELGFPVIRGYLGFLQAAVQDGVMRKDLLGSAFHADWVPPRRGMASGNTPDLPMRELFNSCYLIYLYQIFVNICRVLERDDCLPEAAVHIAELREGVHREFYDEARGYYLIPEQIYQAMPLLTGVVPEDLCPPVKERLLGLIEKQGWHMDTGLPGTTLLLDLLMQLGAHEVIRHIYNQETYPGWGYMLSQGATTIWEQWNGFWSQIHSCFAGPAEWFYRGLAGIQPDEKAPGFKRFILAPAFVEDIEFVEASYESTAGRIESNWRREDGHILWSIRIPENSAASVHVPIKRSTALTVNGQVWTGDKRLEIGTGERQSFVLSFTAGIHELRWLETSIIPDEPKKGKR